jgi:hypothetical protein
LRQVVRKVKRYTRVVRVPPGVRERSEWPAFGAAAASGGNDGCTSALGGRAWHARARPRAPFFQLRRRRPLFLFARARATLPPLAHLRRHCSAFVRRDPL